MGLRPARLLSPGHGAMQELHQEGGVPAAGARPDPCLSPSHPAALMPSVPQLPMPGSRTPSPHARRWQWRPSASSSWLQAAGLPSGKVREWGKVGGKAEAVGVLLRGWCSGKGSGGVLGVHSWGRRCVGAMAVGSPAGEAAEGAGELQPSSPSPEMGARAGQQLGLRTSATVLLAGACRGRCPR